MQKDSRLISTKKKGENHEKDIAIWSHNVGKILILALIGVLGVTGIYMYKKGMDSVRADSVVKDVLIRAEQKNVRLIVLLARLFWGQGM